MIEYVLCLQLARLPAASHAAQAATRPEERRPPARDEGLRRELLGRVKVDQDVRFQLIREGPDAAKNSRFEKRQARLEQVDRANTLRMKEIVAAYGWPGRSLVGPDGAQAAFLLVQHADRDPEFQKACLPLVGLGPRRSPGARGAEYLAADVPMTEVKCPPVPGYEPVRFLGSSCLLGGTIHIARKLDEGVLVALQVFPQGPADGPGAMQVAKARRLLPWRHPDVLRVIDVGQLGPRCYVALECIEPSVSLARRLESGSFPVRAALSAAHRAAAVIEDARSEGLVCTRWSLSSILLADDDTPKLCAWDFDAREKLPPQWFLGSPAFTPPEWLTAEPSEVSPAADVYTIGVALYAMLSGRAPFTGESLMQVFQHVLEGSPAPVREIAPDVPESAEALCVKCLGRDPAERFRGLVDLMQAISSVAADLAP